MLFYSKKNFKDGQEELMRRIAIMLAIIWCTFSIILGLAQFWNTLFNSIFDKEIYFDSNTVFRSCAFLFFSTTISAAIALDFLFDLIRNKEPVILTLKELFIFSIPIFVVMVSIKIHDVYCLGRPEDIYLSVAQLLVFCFSVLYAFCMKFSNFNLNDEGILKW